jgi:hypothetical protein
MAMANLLGSAVVKFYIMDNLLESAMVMVNLLGSAVVMVNLLG